MLYIFCIVSPPMLCKLYFKTGSVWHSRVLWCVWCSCTFKCAPCSVGCAEKCAVISVHKLAMHNSVWVGLLTVRWPQACNAPSLLCSSSPSKHRPLVSSKLAFRKSPPDPWEWVGKPDQYHPHFDAWLDSFSTTNPSYHRYACSNVQTQPIYSSV